MLIRGPHSRRYLQPFDLPAADGARVRLWDYRQRRNVVLFVHHGSTCPRCRAELTRFARRYQAYRERDAEVLAIGPDGPALSADLAQTLDLPFPLLSDPGGLLVSRQGVQVPAVLIGDRFEEIWAAWAPRDDLELPTQEEIVSWLEFISIQCHYNRATLEWDQER
jgi:peroxiredoxin